MMTRRLLLGGTLLLCGVFSRSLRAQTPGSIAGRVTLESTGEGIPDVAITLCQDSGREVVSETSGAESMPPRDKVKEVRITNYPGVLSVADAKSVVLREGEEVSSIDIVVQPLPPLQLDLATRIR